MVNRINSMASERKSFKKKNLEKDVTNNCSGPWHRKNFNVKQVKEKVKKALDQRNYRI